MVKNNKDVKEDYFEKLIKIVEVLRGKNGCPWDKKQTISSISVYLTEEFYELIEAIENDDPGHVCEETGDVLFLLLFMIQLYKEKALFEIDDVLQKNIGKMIRRHPHIFGDKKINNSDDVSKQWEKIKYEEKNSSSRNSILDSIPKALPPLARSYKVSERAAKCGFDWENLKEVIEKAEEEWTEFKEAVKKKDLDNIRMEFGDVLFTLTNVARFAKIHPDASLVSSIKKFDKRFRYMEKMIIDKGKQIDHISRDEFDRLWEKAKIEA